MKNNTPKNIYILAGPNGAGKTTFAKVLLPQILQIQDFVNADLIAAGLSPFAPEKEAVQAGKLMLKQIDKLTEQGQSFCLETTLSGRAYLPKIAKWQSMGYTVHLFFLSLPDAKMAINRVAERVKQGGHHIPDDVVRRRYAAGLKNFHELYKSKVNTWALFDNTGDKPHLLDEGENISKETRALFDAATKGLELARLEARKIAIQTNTNLIVYDREKGMQKIPASELVKNS